MKINVTRNDINKGRRGSLGYCPIALAVKRAAKGWLVEVRCEFVIFTKKEVARTRKLPDKAQRFVSYFDKGVGADILKPFSFSVRDV